MSDYGLLSRKLALDVEYEDSPCTSAVAKVPVFAVGREQLYEMFGLFGRDKSTKPINFPVNYVCGSIGEYIQDACYVLVSFGRWADGTPSRMVTLSHAYETFEQCYFSVACCIELDAWDLIRSHSGLIYDYEVWQICDDYNLYAHWDMSADRCMRETGQNYKFSQAWRLSYEDTADYQSEIECQMSNDYLSSLKTHNAHCLESLRQLREAGELERMSRIRENSRMKETCYFCGCFLPGKNFAVQYRGEMKFVCRACFDLYNKHDHDGLRYRTIDTFICDCCGRTMKDEYYVDSSIGTYCAECKKQDSDLGEFFVCDRCGKRLTVDQLGHTVEGTYCKDCRYELVQGLSSCNGDCCDPGTFPDPICHNCEYANWWRL